LAAFLAAVGGALLGPVTGQASTAPFGAVQSLLLVVIFALQAPFGDLSAPLAAGFAMTVLPGYITSSAISRWLPVLFGVAAVAVAIRESAGVRSDADDRQPKPLGLRRPLDVRRAVIGPARMRLIELLSQSAG